MPTLAGGLAFALYGTGQSGRANPHPCRASEHRQFDFWLGKWNIENPDGQNVGTSVITSEMDSCLVMEDFIAANGLAGRSLVRLAGGSELRMSRSGAARPKEALGRPF